MITKSELKGLYIEHTSRCNLQCPSCARKHAPNNSKDFRLADMTLDDYKRIFDKELCNQLDIVRYCGSYGDAVASNTFFESVKYLVENGVSFALNTNGSMRSEEWWRELAYISDKKSKVIFSIDGLEDTNHLYRIGSNFQKIIRNAKAFIDAGGVARWDYIVFDHNKHQVEEAQQLAKDLGFYIFNIKWSKRGLSDDKMRKALDTNTHDEAFGGLLDRYGTWRNYINQTKIDCIYKDLGFLYLDYELNLWPCCWTGCALFFHKNSIQKEQFDKIINRYEPGFNSLRNKSIDEVLAHEFFAKDLTESWTNKIDDENEKLIICGRTCGEKYSSSGGAESNRKTIILRDK